ncbi:MAG: hypothetical protein Q8N08_04020 [Methanobacteriaceae archaeon]|nr:hypothetical protein [Methanobacteriaceae archaeon]
MLEFFISPVGMAMAMAELAAIPPSVDKGKEALWALAPEVEELAKSLAPYRSGDLKASIRCVPTKDGLRLYSNLDYAYWQEYGFFHKKAGRWIPGKFYMTKAMDAYVTTKSTDNKIFDKIEREAKKKAAVTAVAGLGLAALFGVASFILMGFSAILSSRM